ncbi:MAG TPA: hypothetical protein VM925_05440 [Labilithrix sp.]|nr:hypothetical protein [Labilithrix sp.]
MRLPLLFVSLLPLAAMGCTASKTCTLLACGNSGIRVDFTHVEPGTYVVDVVVDGTQTTCTATLPLKATEPTDDACSAAGILLTRSGSAMPAADQSIGGLQIQRANANSVTVRVTRDGKLLHDATFSPNYVVTPGPNGPDCDPKECKGATFALP